MTNTSSAGALAARVLLAFMFILAGWAKLGDIQGAMAYTASGGLPGFFVFPAIAVELLGGLAILVGWQTRWAALALAGFAVIAGILYHYIPALGLDGYDRVAPDHQLPEEPRHRRRLPGARQLRPRPLLAGRAPRPLRARVTDGARPAPDAGRARAGWPPRQLFS